MRSCDGFVTVFFVNSLGKVVFGMSALLETVLEYK